MSIFEKSFEIPPPEVKPQREISWFVLVLKPLLCVLVPMIFPTIVYIMEGWSTLFWWMFGFGFLISLFLLSFDLQKVECVLDNNINKPFDGIHRRKVPHIPSHYKKRFIRAPSSYKNLTPDSAQKNPPSAPRSHILDKFDQPQPTVPPTFVEIPISLDSPSISSESDASAQQPTTFTANKKRMISAPSISLSPLGNKLKALKGKFPRKLYSFNGSFQPLSQSLKDATLLSTIQESTSSSATLTIC